MVMRFAEGRLPLGEIVTDTTNRPLSTKFTLVENFFSIGHVDLCDKFLAKELKSFYQKLEYPSHYYTLLKPGADPKALRSKVAKGDVKLKLLCDLLPQALWAKKHLIWFESDDEHANFRVRSSTVANDTMAIVQGVMRCSE